MSKLWGGRFEGEISGEMEAFSSSIDVDAKLWRVDLRSSAAHARMLGEQGIISRAEAEQILRGLGEIQSEIESGRWTFDPGAEDIHGEIEKRLFEKIGSAAKKVHTARSRNDQVATDTRLYLAEKIEGLGELLRAFQSELVSQAEAHVDTILPGMTHLQHAQPVSLAHHLLAYFWMFQRDQERLLDSRPRVLSMPLGSAALAGTGFPIDRARTAEEMGFASVAENSMDAVSDRDFVIEFLSNASIIMMHLSRLCEDLILWSTPEFGFVELGDAVTTGSSIMPQKKNPDVAELVRGRTGRLYGALVGALTMMKGLPLSYNRDMQEDKVHLFEGLETVESCVRLMTLAVQSAKWNPQKMRASLKGDFSNATDLADDLVLKGLTFREAHEIVGRVVRWCLENSKGLEDLNLDELRGLHSLFDEKSLRRLPHDQVMAARVSTGGTAPSAVREQLLRARALL